MKKTILKRASEVTELYDMRTKYYFLGYIDFCPGESIHSDIDYYFDKPDCEYKRAELHEMLNESLQASRSWPKYIRNINLKDLRKYLKEVSETSFD